MSAENISLFTSGVFDFDIGPEKTHFTLHTKLVSRHSRPLLDLMASDLSKRSIQLSDIDCETFGRFAEYIYSGDYSSAQPYLEATAEVNGEETDDGTDNDADDEGIDKGDDDVQVYVEGNNNFVSEDAPEENGKAPEEERLQDEKDIPFLLLPTPRCNESSDEVYLPVFMCHAELYIFAKKYSIPDLRDLAAQSLLETLHDFHCYPERAGDIAKLIKHVYDNTDGEDSCQLPLRAIVAEYAASNFKTLMVSAEFKDLVEDGGSFDVDLLTRIAGMR